MVYPGGSASYTSSPCKGETGACWPNGVACLTATRNAWASDNQISQRWRSLVCEVTGGFQAKTACVAGTRRDHRSGPNYDLHR